jgi:hypothetical protein
MGIELIYQRIASGTKVEALGSHGCSHKMLVSNIQLDLNRLA